MSVFQIIAVLLTLTALFSYLNYRFIYQTADHYRRDAHRSDRVAGLIALHHFWVQHRADGCTGAPECRLRPNIAAGNVELSALRWRSHINLNDLAKQKWVITILAVVGLLISTFVFATAIYLVLAGLNLKLRYVWCLLFGALISPTDPIAVLGILESAKVPKSLEIQIAGESLFNDGIGVVVFLVLYEIAVHEDQPSFTHISTVFIEEAVGGAVAGLLLGWITYRLLKAVDQYQVSDCAAASRSQHTLRVALVGLVTIAIYKIVFTG
jgi:CPA1 family monovalent cation:H+ antiporter